MDEYETGRYKLIKTDVTKSSDKNRILKIRVHALVD